MTTPTIEELQAEIEAVDRELEAARLAQMKRLRDAVLAALESQANASADGAAVPVELPKPEDSET